MFKIINNILLYRWWLTSQFVCGWSHSLSSFLSQQMRMFYQLSMREDLFSMKRMMLSAIILARSRRVSENAFDIFFKIIFLNRNTCVTVLLNCRLWSVVNVQLCEGHHDTWQESFLLIKNSWDWMFLAFLLFQSTPNVIRCEWQDITLLN